MGTPPPATKMSARAARAESGQALFNTLAQAFAGARWVLALAVVGYALSGVTRVAPHEEAVVFRWGRPLPATRPPGLVFAWPPPLDRVVKVPTRTQQERTLTAWGAEDRGTPDRRASSAPELTPLSSGIEAAVLNPTLLAVHPRGGAAAGAPTEDTAAGLHPVFDGYTLTGDANILHARLSARYRITDPHAYLATVREGEEGTLVDAVVYAAAAAQLASTPIDSALGSGLDALRVALQDDVQRRLDALGCGLTLVGIDLAGLSPPLATAAAFADVTSARVEAATLGEQARTQRAELLPQSQAEAHRLRELADADSRRLAARAAAETSAFLQLLTEYRRDPVITRERLRAETLEVVLARAAAPTVVPAGTGAFHIPLGMTK